VKFIDEVTIIVQSGKGGAGCVSFRRERAIPRGGPDGGSGGKGGDVILRAAPNKRTLYHLQFKKEYQAANGAPGQGRLKSGHNGEDLTIDLPVGTVIREVETGEILHDLVDLDQPFILAQGGRGGMGNAHFKSSTHRSPRFAQPGEPGRLMTIRLELKLIADVGIIGLPNAGKSTLISVISAARPKIADYPFTTLSPNLGVVTVAGGEPFVVADIPGLIPGAHAGAGLGIRFLRHVERTRFLVHLIDAGELDLQKPLEAYNAINHELAMYSRTLAEKPQLVVLNKLDVTGADEAAEAFRRALPDRQVLQISAATHKGVDELKFRIRQQLDTLHEQP